jgi:hypothetical protein
MLSCKQTSGYANPVPTSLKTLTACPSQKHLVMVFGETAAALFSLEDTFKTQRVGKTQILDFKLPPCPV